MIELEGLASRRAPLALGRLTLSWKPGVHAIVGTPGDGGPLLLSLIAGRERLRAGRIRVLDGSPEDTRVRRRVAFVPREPTLPDCLRVRDVLAIAAKLRDDPPSDPTARLAALGLGALAPRPVRSLSVDEVHTVALVEALTSPEVRVLLLDEPLVGLDPRASSFVPGRLRERAREGCTVLVATASLRDAGELADDHLLMRAGAIAGRAGSIAELAAFSPDGVRMCVVSNDPQALVAALASEEAVEAVARRDTAVVARGHDVSALAIAVSRAITISGVELIEMRIEPPSLDDARAAASGIAAATYDAAYARTRAALAPSGSPPPPEPAT